MIYWVKQSGTQDVLSGRNSHLYDLKAKIYELTCLFLYSVNTWEIMTGRNPVFLLISICIFLQGGNPIPGFWTISRTKIPHHLPVFHNNIWQNLIKNSTKPHLYFTKVILEYQETFETVIRQVIQSTHWINKENIAKVLFCKVT